MIKTFTKDSREGLNPKRSLEPVATCDTDLIMVPALSASSLVKLEFGTSGAEAIVRLARGQVRDTQQSCGNKDCSAGPEPGARHAAKLR
jgi:hypothetical protein